MTESKKAEGNLISTHCRPLKVRHKRKRKVFSCTECNKRKQECDRSFPYSNYILRNKQSIYHHGTESTTKQQLLRDDTTTSSSGDGGSVEVLDLESESIAQINEFGFAIPNDNDNTTLGIFKNIWSHVTDSRFSLPTFPSITMDKSKIREKYRSLIRQLPSKLIIGTRIKVFFHEVNHQYDSLDEAIFRDDLNAWQIR